MVTEKKIYNGIDLFKLIAACLVVLLHTIETTAWYPYEIKYVCTSFAVPFFFMASGYFFYFGLSKAENRKMYLINYIKHIVLLFIIWAIIIFGPFTVLSYLNIYAGESVITILAVLFRRFFVIGPGAYWYLLALMWSSLFLYFCFVKNNTNLLYVGIILGLIFEVCYSSLQGVLSQFTLFRIFFKVIYFVFSWKNNFLMYGIPFMGIGYLIAQNNLSISTQKSKAIFVISTVGAIIEYNLPIIFPSAFWNDNRLEFCFILQAIAIFMLAKDSNYQISSEKSKSIRQLSAFIYFLHVPLLNHFLNPLLKHYIGAYTYSSVMIAPKLLILLGFSFMCFLLIKKVNNKYLNILING